MSSHIKVQDIVERDFFGASALLTLSSVCFLQERTIKKKKPKSCWIGTFHFTFHNIQTWTAFFCESAAAVRCGYLCRDANQQQPLLLQVRSVVDDLTACQTGVAVKDFGRLGISLHAPVVDGRVRHQGDGVYRDPLPEHDVLRHGVSLHLALHLDVKDLQRLRSCGAAGNQGGGAQKSIRRSGLVVLREGHGQDEDGDSWMIKSLLLFDTLDGLHWIYCLQLKQLMHYMTLLHSALPHFLQANVSDSGFIHLLIYFLFCSFKPLTEFLTNSTFNRQGHHSEPRNYKKKKKNWPLSWFFFLLFKVKGVYTDQYIKKTGATKKN